MSDLQTPGPETRLELLHPLVRPVVELVLEQLRAEGWQPRIVETWRSAERQAYLVAEGASRRSVSPHQWTEDELPASLAVDIIDRRYGYNSPRAAEFFGALCSAAEARGMTSGHRWRWKDSAHIQAVSQGALAELQAGGALELGHLGPVGPLELARLQPV